MFIKNKVALITGGASGIGLCYAKELLKNGLRAVTIADADITKGHKAVVQITDEYGLDKVRFVETDVTDKDQFKTAFERTIERFGNVDILINNAGIMNEAAWERQIAINLNGTIYGCLLAMEEYIPKYKTADEGVIVNVSSIAGLTKYPAVPVYTATKHAIIGLSRSLGEAEHRDQCKIRVLTICPGVTDTSLFLDLETKMFNERYRGILEIGYKTRMTPNQSPEDVAKNLITIIEEGSSGSVWVAEASQLYEIEIPNKEKFKKLK